MTVVSIVALFVIALGNEAFDGYPYLFLMPWIVGLAVLMAIPSIVLYYRGRFSLADPIVFATWSYFFPAFVLGGFFFAVGWSQPFFISFIQDANYNLPLTVVLIGVGFAGLAIGCFLPVGRKLGEWVRSLLPTADYEPSKYIGPGIVLLILGIFNTILAFALGLFGYQRADEINTYDGLIYFTTLFWLQASFLLWSVIFKKPRLSIANLMVIGLLIATAISKALFAGNRGSLLQVFSLVILAYVLSGRRFNLRQTVISGSVLVILIVVGMIYGTTFREVKGTESKQGFDQYADNVSRTMEQIGNSDLQRTLEYGFSSLTERIDVLSTVAVVVSNYEQLAPYEEAYDLDNNIWKDMTTSLVPRIIWKEKPFASDPRKFSDLYFSFGETSFAITPIGDLLRNYGIAGVALGMMVLGMFLRFFYSALIEDQPRSLWRSTLYFMLLTSVSYEAFYGMLIPNFFKVGFTAIVGTLIVTFFINKRSTVERSSCIRPGTIG